MQDFDFPVNLDAMTIDPTELDTWAKSLREAVVPGLTLANKVRLAQYADTKARAMRSRLAGDITSAQRLEAECERLYTALPQRYKW